MLKTPVGSTAFYIKMETPKCQVPCAIAEICRKMIQLRTELDAVSERQGNTTQEPFKESNQMKLALKAMDEAISKLHECENVCGKSIPMAAQEPTRTAPLSIFERATLFQSWDTKRKRQEQNQPPAKQQKTANSQISCGVRLL